MARYNSQTDDDQLAVALAAPLGSRPHQVTVTRQLTAVQKHASEKGVGNQFRVDIQGLRGVAVGLVLLYHAGLPFVPGGFVGVDVFFVLSGFLITSMLAAELDRSGTVSLVKFYARRAKRLLPAAAVVLAATFALTRLFLPGNRWQEIGGDIVSAALYVVNWRLADRSVDYLAEDSEPSPVQHFWSLAVEEQYYLVWPLLILLAVVVAGAARIRTRTVVWLGLAVVAVPSLAWSVLATAHTPERAFFLTTTRVWELAAGAAVALAAAHWRRLPPVAATGLGWAGLVAIAGSALAFSVATPWPGYAAVLPVLGTVAVIVAGSGASHSGVGSLLSTRPLRWLGDISYSLYLWHWPLLVVATAYWGGLSPQRGLVVAVAAVLPAWLTYRLVENPIRYSTAVSRSPALALSFGANFSLVGVAAGVALLLAVSNAMEGSATAEARVAPGAAVLAKDPRGDPAGAAPEQVDHLVPDPLLATKDIPDVYDDGCHQNQQDAEVLSCVYGNPDSETVVAVAGDSKIAQWIPALQLLADRNDWKLVTYTKSACSFAATTIQDGNGRPYRSCTQWAKRLQHRLTGADRPDYVLTANGASQAIGPDGSRAAQPLVDGLAQVWTALLDAGSQVIVVADNPHPGMNVYECVEENPKQLSACTYDRDRRETSGGYKVQREALRQQPAAALVDLFDAVCPVHPCSPVIGNVLVYRQGAHLTATYVESLAPRLARALTRAGLPAEYGPDAGR